MMDLLVSAGEAVFPRWQLRSVAARCPLRRAAPRVPLAVPAVPGCAERGGLWSLRDSAARAPELQQEFLPVRWEERGLMEVCAFPGERGPV